MRYFFLLLGALAAAALWAHNPDDKALVKRQLSEVPGYSIMPQ